MNITKQELNELELWLDQYDPQFYLYETEVERNGSTEPMTFIESLHNSDLLKMLDRIIGQSYERGFEDGKRAKQTEIRKALGQC